MSDFGFSAMAFMFKVRDFFRPREDIVEEVGLKEGFHVLDYGCGPGGYVKPVADLVGESGRIYALDINPRAIQMVKKIVAKNLMRSVETILSDCSTGLPDDSVDAVLLYDFFHDLTDPNRVLEELYRVLKPAGVLSFSDHHLKEDEIMSKLTNKGLFALLKKGTRTYSFAKKQA
ncbi:MAG: class I SAM-dependent methyltransferase [Candidatus Bathyarchaeia archaeon]|jgi:ubiquinone/menaquinone biosynthesis C-methylase UbiE